MPVTRLLAAVAVATMLLASGCRAGRAGRAGIVPVLREHLQRYPAMQIEDVYKLAHQAAFGNGHLIADEEAARAYLFSELDAVAADAAEPLIEPINADGSVVRVNLRPFKARGGDPRRLADAMLRSSRAFRPDPQVFEASWQGIAWAAERGDVPFDAQALRSFAAAKRRDGYPAVHHSGAYAAEYRPAYRVLTGAEASRARQP